MYPKIGLQEGKKRNAHFENPHKDEPGILVEIDPQLL